MSVHVGIFGFGRIGRNVFRLARKHPGLEVTAIVDVADPLALEYLLRFDTVHGRFDEPFAMRDGTLEMSDRRVQVVTKQEPCDVDWAGLGVEMVVDATHKYQTRAALEGHLAGGARRVILASPPRDPLDFLAIGGVNDAGLRAEQRLLSTGSPTANCLALIAKILHDAFRIERGFVTSVHAYTNDQRLADVPHSDLRRSRAAAENIIPSATHSAHVVGEVIPELRGKLEGIAMNVPVPDGSALDFTTLLEREVTVEGVNAAVRAAALGPYRGIVEYAEQPLVSSDVIGNSHSAVFDALSTQIVGGNLVKTVSWYDNGWGYASRVVELIDRLRALDGGR